MNPARHSHGSCRSNRNPLQAATASRIGASSGKVAITAARSSSHPRYRSIHSQSVSARAVRIVHAPSRASIRTHRPATTPSQPSPTRLHPKAWPPPRVASRS
ncbi:MAG: hypothetical protein DVB31_16050 [Verrucomicrobia bacterium]|nr:MAG: hypothetical protein DVB31_16050 [Verrucomicrobiota bacterium]